MTTHKQPTAPIDITEQFLTEDGWTFERHADRPLLRIPFSGKQGRYECFAQERNGNQLLFYVVAPIVVADDKRVAAAVYLTQANYGLAIGNFELDLSDGEFRYKTSIDVGESQLTSHLVQRMIYVACLMMDKYLPGMMRVLHGGVDPLVAAREADVQELLPE